jgi:hypothetical protein
MAGRGRATLTEAEATGEGRGSDIEEEALADEEGRGRSLTVVLSEREDNADPGVRPTVRSISSSLDSSSPPFPPISPF